jgi:hypothetical protein
MLLPCSAYGTNLHASSLTLRKSANANTNPCSAIHVRRRGITKQSGANRIVFLFPTAISLSLDLRALTLSLTSCMHPSCSEEEETARQPTNHVPYRYVTSLSVPLPILWFLSGAPRACVKRSDPTCEINQDRCASCLRINISRCDRRTLGGLLVKY